MSKTDASQELLDKGFLILRNVVSGDELVPLRQLIDEVIECEEAGVRDPFAGTYLEHRTDQGVLYDVYQRHPEFHALAHNDRILDVLVPVLGDNIYLYVNSVVYKPKGRRNGVPWHQDFLSRPQESRRYIAWVSLHQANRENGCLKVIPGSHKAGYLPWHRIGGETHHDRVKSEFVDETLAVYLELDEGDAVIFDQCLLHSSDEVATDAPRMAFRVVYKALDSIEVPRGAPIVVRGGRPKSLKLLSEKEHLKDNTATDRDTRPQTRRIPLPVRILARKIGHRLLTLAGNN